MCPRRGLGKTVCARGAWVALLGGRSSSSLAAMSRPSTRPGLVWLITVCYAICFALLALGGWATLKTWGRVPESAKAPLRSISLAAWIGAAIWFTVILVAVVQLFRMRRSAFYLCATALILSVAMSVWYYMNGTYYQSGTYLVGLLVQLLVCFYVWRLLRANALS